MKKVWPIDTSLCCSLIYFSPITDHSIVYWTPVTSDQIGNLNTILLYKGLKRGSLISQQTNGFLRCRMSLKRPLWKIILPYCGCHLMQQASCVALWAGHLPPERIANWSGCKIIFYILLIEYAVDYWFKCTSDYECNTNPPYKVAV